MFVRLLSCYYFCRNLQLYIRITNQINYPVYDFAKLILIQ